MLVDDLRRRGLRGWFLRGCDGGKDFLVEDFRTEEGEVG